MRKSKQLSSKDRGLQSMKCMNSNPEESKWGAFAPKGGCTETVMVDSNTSKVLCSRCTSRSCGAVKVTKLKD